MIRAGKSDTEIMDFLVARYGDFVRYRPPLKATTVLLWGGPFVLLLGGIAGLLMHLRQRNAQTDAPLDEAERRRVAALLADADKRNVSQ